jgi:hypothetical protein
MKLAKPLVLAVIAVATLAIGATASHSQNEGPHPAFLKALNDLRLMRGYLDKLTPAEQIDEKTQSAIDEIDAAIHEIKEAGIDDGKGLRDHAQIDAAITPSERFHKARSAGNAAWNDLIKEADNDFGHGAKHRALEHIGNANQTVNQILRRLATPPPAQQQ